MPDLAWQHSFASSHRRGQGAELSELDFGTVSAPATWGAPRVGKRELCLCVLPTSWIALVSH